MDDVSYGVLALALTLAGGTYAWWAYQRRGLGAGLRGAGIALLPAAAWLTDTLRMLTRVADAVGDWATRLVLSPAVWLGIVLAGVAVLLYGAGRLVDARGGRAEPRPRRSARTGTQPRGAVTGTSSTGTSSTGGSPAIADDDDLADIEAILRKRGIS